MSESVKDRGVILDSDLSMHSQFSEITKICFLQLMNISNIRKHLTTESTIILTLSIGLTGIDICVVLLDGAPSVQINRPQNVQNIAATIVSLVRKHDSITPILRILYWLPVQHRITFKIICLAHQLLCNGFCVQVTYRTSCPSTLFIHRV